MKRAIHYNGQSLLFSVIDGTADIRLFANRFDLLFFLSCLGIRGEILQRIFDKYTFNKIELLVIPRCETVCSLCQAVI